VYLKSKKITLNDEYRDEIRELKEQIQILKDENDKLKEKKI
jgi:hypothetical protein